MVIRVVTTAYGAPALEALRGAVADAKRADPMSLVTVIAPNNIAGIVCRRFLAAGTGGRPGVAGIHVTTPSKLAERIGVPFLAPRRPATRTVTAAAWRHVLADAPGRFGDIADHPATVRALVAAHAELRDLTDEALRAVSVATQIGRDLVALHQAVNRRLSTSWYDATDILTVAAQHVEGDGAYVLYLPQVLTRAEARFAAALGGDSDVAVVSALTGARRADEALEETLTLLDARPGQAPRIKTASRVINASDSDDEIRCVVRDVMSTVRRTPAHRVAVLYSAAVPYARLLHEQLTAAGLSFNGAGVRAADERAVARTLLEVLALVDHDLPRADLFRALANAPVRDFAGERIPTATWERTSRSAGVVAGSDWTARLDSYVDHRRAQADGERAAAEPRDWWINRLDRDAATAIDLRRFAGALRDELHRADQMTTWRELASWCQQLFTTLLGSPESLSKLPPEEQYAAAAIVSILHGLEGLDTVETSANLQILRDVLDAELAGSLPRVGRFGEGVFVGPLSAAIGLDLDVVYLVGLSEDLYPGRPRPDALLSDRARDATNGELAGQRERLHAKFRHLLAALACADVAVVSFPRGDLRRSTKRLPSRWLLPTLRALSGEQGLAASTWDQAVSYGDRLLTSGSFAGELVATTALGTDQEWRTRQARASGRLDDAAVRAAVALTQARASKDLTRYDGNLAGAEGLPDYASDGRPVSPTALEDYAECPHGYFVERLLGVSPLEQPEDIVVIAPNEIGNLIHRSVDDLVSEFADQLPGAGEPWTSAQQRRLVEIVSENAEVFQRRGLTGHPRLWERERVRIINDAIWLLNDDDRWRAAVNARVITSELAFGMKGYPPIEVAVPGGRIIMRGSADRLDQGADGTLYVTDIKTGSARKFKDITQEDPLVKGTKLQLPIYAYAARDRFGGPTTPVQAAYSFVRRDRRRIAIQLTPQVERAYARTLSVIVRSISAGLFPPKAPDKPDFASWAQCGYCNPDGIGHADNRERWERKRHDPILRDLVELIEPEALAE